MARPARPHRSRSSSEPDRPASGSGTGSPARRARAAAGSSAGGAHASLVGQQMQRQLGLVEPYAMRHAVGVVAGAGQRPFAQPFREPRELALGVADLGRAQRRAPTPHPPPLPVEHERAQMGGVADGVGLGDGGGVAGAVDVDPVEPQRGAHGVHVVGEVAVGVVLARRAELGRAGRDRDAERHLLRLDSDSAARIRRAGRRTSRRASGSPIRLGRRDGDAAVGVARRPIFSEVDRSIDAPKIRDRGGCHRLKRGWRWCCVEPGGRAGCRRCAGRDGSDSVRGPRALERPGFRHRSLAVMQWHEGVITALSVPERRVPFDADAGPDGGGRPVAVFSRCAKEASEIYVDAPVWSEARGCDIWQVGLDGGNARRVAAVDTRGGSEPRPRSGATRSRSSA